MEVLIVCVASFVFLDYTVPVLILRLMRKIALIAFERDNIRKEKDRQTQ